jgi:hypothetical protein
MSGLAGFAAMFLWAGLACKLAEASSRWQQIAPSVTRWEGDGERFLAWQVEAYSPTVVLDSLTGKEQEVPGCRLFEPNLLYLRRTPAGHGRFLLVCGYTVDLFDARTGVIKALPDVTGVEGWEWGGVGADYVEGEGSPLRCRRDRAEKAVRSPCIALYEIATGAITYRPRREAADLNRPGAAVCSALRKKADHMKPFGGASFDGELFAEPGAPLRIWRCHAPPLIIPGTHRHETEGAEIAGDNLISWSTGHYAPDDCLEACSPAVRNGNVFVYSLTSGRRWRLKPPTSCVELGYATSPCGIFGYSTHTSSLVFWIATRTVEGNETGTSIGKSTVYAAKLEASWELSREPNPSQPADPAHG